MNLKTATGICALACVLTFAGAAQAEDHVEGSLVVDGKATKLTHVYAFAQKGFFDPKKRDVVVLFCDVAAPPAGVRDPFAREDLIKSGKLYCVEQTIDTGKQVINYKVQHSAFGKPEGGGSTSHVFEAKTLDAKTIAGRSRTTAPQKSFDDVPYSYDITFSAAIGPMK
jgi:hypothetical protein